MASRNAFFNVHSSRRLLYAAVQARNHWAPMTDLDGDSFADLLAGRYTSPSIVPWRGFFSDGTSFASSQQLASDAGSARRLFLAADVSGDGLRDGDLSATNTVSWTVHRSTGGGLAGAANWSSDGGDGGDIFRLADVDGDGRADLGLRPSYRSDLSIRRRCAGTSACRPDRPSAASASGRATAATRGTFS